MHIHELTRRLYASLIDILPGPRNSQIPDVRVQKQRLLDRLTDIEDELSTQMLVLDMLKKRFENLVDLEFNVDSAKTDITVAAISVLTFAIVGLLRLVFRNSVGRQPTHMQQSIVGITTMSEDPKWFAVSGGIVAALSIMSWFAINQYYSNVESQSHGQTLLGGARDARRRKKTKVRRPGDPEVGAEGLEYESVKMRRYEGTKGTNRKR